MPFYNMPISNGFGDIWPTTGMYAFLLKSVSFGRNQHFPQASKFLRLCRKSGLPYIKANSFSPFVRHWAQPAAGHLSLRSPQGVTLFLCYFTQCCSLLCLAARSNNFIVGLTDVSPVDSPPSLWNYTLCGQYPGAVPAGATVSLYCQDNLPPFRYVIVHFPRTDHMNFCELEVLVVGMKMFWIFYYCVIPNFYLLRMSCQ